MEVVSYMTSKRPQDPNGKVFLYVSAETTELREVIPPDELKKLLPLSEPTPMTLKPGKFMLGKSIDELTREIEENKYALEERVITIKISSTIDPLNSAS